MLNELMQRQRKFSSNFIDFSDNSILYKEKITNDLLMALVEEVIEARRCIHCKSWKKREYEPDINQLKEELIDCLCFLMNLFVLWDMSVNDIFQIYINKMEKNESRFIRTE